MSSSGNRQGIASELNLLDDTASSNNYNQVNSPPQENSSALDNGLVHNEAAQDSCFIQDNLYIFHYIMIGMACFGLITNIISYIVLHRRYTSNTVIFFFKCLCIVDAVLLFCALATNLNDFLRTRSFSSKYAAFGYYCFSTILYDIFQLMSVWFTVILAYYRYVSVSKPMETRMYSDKTQGWIIALVLFGIVGTINAIRVPFVMSCTGNDQQLYECKINYYDYRYVRYIDAAYFGLFYFILPFFPLLVFSVGLVRTMQNLQSNRQPGMPSIKQESDSMTKVVIAIVVVFIITYCPIVVWSLSYTVEPMYEYFATHICQGVSMDVTIHIGMHINSSVNFIFYVCLIAKFRQNLCSWCSQCTSNSRKSSVCKTDETGTSDEKKTLNISNV